MMLYMACRITRAASVSTESVLVKASPARVGPFFFALQPGCLGDDDRMYAGFILSAQDARALLQATPLQETAERRINEQNAKLVRDKLESFLLNDGAIDADKMQQAWLPLVRRHVFLSHSHKRGRCEPASAIAAVSGIEYASRFPHR